MSVEKRYYSSVDSARRALRKWGVGGSYLDFIGEDPNGEKRFFLWVGKDGPIENDPLDLSSPVERGVQVIDAPKAEAARRGAAVHKAIETGESTGDANLDALVDAVRNAEPPMHRKQKAKLEKAKRKAERKRRLKAQRKNRKGGK